ncbi:MAG: phosphoenolpyruvate carboxylase [archaeon]|nr:phosphoenolpyruvate carboxylase [archaeon]
MAMHNIARCMSTQHPDNVSTPFFADNTVISGDDEIKEAFHVYSHLKAREQLWDCEGKEVDNFVIRKLFSRYPSYFEKKRLGKDVFMLLRTPNPAVEKSESKLLLEVLESIPRSFDISDAIYNDDVAPLFEVSIPMISSEKTLIRIAEYYKRFVSGKQNATLIKGDIALSKWIGRFFPETIRVMPLFETKTAMLNADTIVRKFVESQKIEDYQRVWFARSDPALNYGSLASTLIGKVAVQRIHSLEKKMSIDLPVMIGVGSAPFRGNFRPDNIENCMKGYPSVQTYTIQSAFKYDFDEDIVKKAIYDLNNSKRGKPVCVDEAQLLEIIEKSSSRYQKEIQVMAPLINSIAKFVPSRRKRKLHIGLFGYSRQSAGVQLPRAIKFTGALYSIGIPPETLGLSALSAKDIEAVREAYPDFDGDMKDSLRYLNKDNMKYIPAPVRKSVEYAASIVDFEVDTDHRKLTSIIMDDFSKGQTEALLEDITKAAWIRRFLG